MTGFLISAAALCLLTVALLTRPLWWRAGQPASSPTEPAANDAAPVDEVKAPPAAPRWKLTAAMTVFVFAVAGAGYYRLGAPGKLALGPESSAAAVAAGGSQVTAEQIAAMVSRLRERLKSQPEDSEGWMMLGRSQAALGQFPEAIDAFRKAVKLRPSDAAALLDLADALAMANDRSLQGEPMQLIGQALKIAPTNPKALGLAGTAAYVNKDYATAVKYWEQLMQAQPAGSELAQRLQTAIAQARQLGGMAAAAPAVATANSPAGSSPAGAPAQVSGVVSLAPALKGKASPEDTVFIFARATEGPRMPLAILRKQVKDLPLKFTLDDGMAMSPAAKLSDHARVAVGARISKSGNAMPQSGDLQGMTSAAVGTSGLQIEISEVLAK